MTSAPRRRKSDETTPQRPQDERPSEVPLETFEQDARQDRDAARSVQENPDGSARVPERSESREAAVDEP